MDTEIETTEDNKRDYKGSSLGYKLLNLRLRQFLNKLKILRKTAIFINIFPITQKASAEKNS